LGLNKVNHGPALGRVGEELSANAAEVAVHGRVRIEGEHAGHIGLNKRPEVQLRSIKRHHGDGYMHSSRSERG